MKKKKATPTARLVPTRVDIERTPVQRSGLPDQIVTCILIVFRPLHNFRPYELDFVFCSEVRLNFAGFCRPAQPRDKGT